MTRVITILSLFLLSVATSVAADKKGEGAKIAFAETQFDFGTILEENGAVSHTFEFENVGDEPLVIVSAEASCGCTRPDYPKDPVKPGRKGKIKVTFYPIGRQGEFTKDVKVRTNAKGKRSVLKIKGVIVPKTKTDKR